MNAPAPVDAAPRLHVLIAMCFLAHWSGAELFTRDVALWLRRRGHSVTVFAGTFGEMAVELQHESIACIDDPALLARRPDVIIGCTHHETVRAILQFPDVPAMSICHDRSNDHGRPPRLSQVCRFVAVDENCRERLIHQHGIGEELVELIQNGVDLLRFPRRVDLPPRPGRALVFSNYAQDDALLAEVRAACVDAGMQLDVFGVSIGNLVREPGALLGSYDLVFAKGRAATEAVAAGCACILFDHSQRSMGEMVGRANIESVRRWNFGRALLTRPVSRACLAEQIARYDGADAAAACSWVRANANLDATGLALERIAFDLVRQRPQVVLRPEQRIDELRRYMKDWVATGHPTGEHVLIARLREEVLYSDEARRASEARAHSETKRRSAEQAQIESLRLRIRTLDEALHASSARERALADQLARVQGESAEAAARHAGLLEAAAQRERTLGQREEALLALAKMQQQESAEAAARHAELLEAAVQRERALDARVRALLASASWRITSPLRAALALARKFVG